MRERERELLKIELYRRLRDNLPLTSSLDGIENSLSLLDDLYLQLYADESMASKLELNVFDRMKL